MTRDEKAAKKLVFISLVFLLTSVLVVGVSIIRGSFLIGMWAAIVILLLYSYIIWMMRSRQPPVCIEQDA